VKLLFTPDISTFDHSPSIDLCSRIISQCNPELEKIVIRTNQKVEIQSIGEWKCLNPNAQKEITELQDFIFDSSEKYKPGEMSALRVIIQENISFTILHNIQQVIHTPNQEDMNLRILLYFTEFFHRRMEDYRFAGSQIPEQVVKVVDILEHLLSDEMSRTGEIK
jgi:hypothetical protein